METDWKTMFLKEKLDRLKAEAGQGCANCGPEKGDFDWGMCCGYEECLKDLGIIKRKKPVKIGIIKRKKTVKRKK